MSTTTAKKPTECPWREFFKCNGRGPDHEMIQTILKEISDKTPPEEVTIPTFGNYYREYPIRITGIQNSDMGLNITGVLDYRDYPGPGRVMNGQPVNIVGYNPTTKKAVSTHTQ